MNTILITVAALILFPFSVYVTAKLAAYGACRGKQLFEQQRSKRDGEEKTRE